MAHPKKPMDLRNLPARESHILIKQGQYGEAAKHLQMAVKLQPDDQGSWVALGDAHRLSGELIKAQEAYKRAVALNPHNDLAEAAMKGSSQLAGATFQSKRADSRAQMPSNIARLPSSTFRGCRRKR